MNRSDLPATDEIRKSYPKHENCKWLWVNDYYDGPISGMVSADGTMYWAERIDSEDWVEQVGPGQDDYERMEAIFFALFDLGKDRTEYEIYWHELFKLCVGDHWDYDENGNRSGKVVGNEATQAFFYGRRKVDYEEMDHKKYPIVGWFVL